MKREQFSLDRASGIGGSDIAAIRGTSPWKSAYDVWLDKTGKGESKDNASLKRGRNLEELILEHYSLISGEELLTNLCCLRSKEYPFLIGHIDAKLKAENVIIEAKSSSLAPSAWERIPEYYLSQVAHYRAIADADRVDVIVLFNSWKETFLPSDYKVFSYYQDKKYEEEIKQAAINFWQNHVLTGIPPEVKTISDASKKYPSSKEECLQADEELTKVVEEYDQLSREIKKLEEQENKLKLDIMKRMGEASTLSSEKHQVTWKNVCSSRVDTNKLKLDHPSVYAECLKQTNQRTFKLRRTQ